MLTLVAKESGLLRAVSRRVVVCDPVRSVTTSTATLADRINIDTAVPKDPNSRIITSIRSALHQIRECTRALRQMDIPWDTSNKKALEKFYHDFEAVRVKRIADLKLMRQRAGGNVRKWVESVFSECRDTMPPNIREFYNKYLKKIDEIEAKTGKPLDDANIEGLKMWKAARVVWRKEAGVTPETIKASYIGVYKDWIDGMRTDLTAAYERVYQALGVKEPVDFLAQYQAVKAHRAAASKK